MGGAGPKSLNGPEGSILDHEDGSEQRQFKVPSGVFVCLFLEPDMQNMAVTSMNRLWSHPVWYKLVTPEAKTLRIDGLRAT